MSLGGSPGGGRTGPVTASGAGFDETIDQAFDPAGIGEAIIVRHGEDVPFRDREREIARRRKASPLLFEYVIGNPL